MTNRRYTEEFKIETVKQITERGHVVAEVAARLVNVQPLSMGQARVPEADQVAAQDQQTEIRHLKAELKRVTEKRDILKKTAVYFAKESG